MGSAAYEKGFNACQLSGYSNPYHEDSSEFDEYERGYFQRLKRSDYGSCPSFGYWVPDLEPVREVSPKYKVEPRENNPYAKARGKY
ncbi:hypothetical protein GNP63_14240 [Aliivibrio fischeri]|uniref:hypothetical protein n=1 Tax=Aliivibrio fischeri TaxID=668 RepID=UPI00080E08C8|nr:hypothetical protein [Aliivibrio fischeri]MUH97694.1 hypothetical protein [Aliivibrio fischeri]MUI64857.1 hypothetical protein [Aliivibrio fischeri]OCH31045.1 hypothetical protein A6E13_18520 [Aliivibrio fischeri]